MPLRVLVVASETPDQQDRRRKRSGQASHETLAKTLRDIDPQLELEHASCVTDDWHDLTAERLATFDGIMFAGSPIQMHEETAEARSAAAFARRTFESATPSFGSCAGLQIATVAAGGTTKPREQGMEVGFARSIVPTEAGRDHPVLADRPIAWDALAMHASVVGRQPEGMVVLARTAQTPVEVAEIRSGNGWHWGVQYHPELDLSEIADAIRSSADDMVEQGLARSADDVESYAAMLETLHRDPTRRDLAWQIGVDERVTDATHRTVEMRNFLGRIAR